jgi:hypothetical protein
VAPTAVSREMSRSQLAWGQTPNTICNTIAITMFSTIKVVDRIFGQYGINLFRTPYRQAKAPGLDGTGAVTVRPQRLTVSVRRPNWKDITDTVT